MTTPAPNTLYYGDNLHWLQRLPAAQVDLVYLDPPFNSNRTYNVLFKEKSGQASAAQLEAFGDTWQWDTAAVATFDALRLGPHQRVGKMINALKEFIGPNDMMAYLVMMTARLIELHRVLKPTGSLYLHCDPTASHYLKVVLDTIFGIAMRGKDEKITGTFMM
jgi:site-specific DNA-methyltransferase (adenine-specific)